MKVLLINIPFGFPAGYKIYLKFPLNLSYVACLIKRTDARLDILDLNLECLKKFGYRKYKNYTREYYKKGYSTPISNFIQEKIKSKLKGVNLVCFNGDLPKIVLPIARYIKHINKNIFIIVGGHIATKFYPLYLAKDQIDIVVIGEGEVTLKNLIKAIKNKKKLSSVPGIAFKKAGSIIITRLRPNIDLDFFPAPKREIFGQERYLIYDKYIGILSSRGCLGRCIFCGRSRILSFRFRNSKKIVSEIEHLIKKYNVRKFIFWDNTLNTNLNHLKSLCDEILKRKLKITWICWIKGDRLDCKSIIKMKESGCEAISMGIESGSQRILDRILKDTNITNLKRTIRLFNYVGIETRTTFIFGFPFEKNIDFLKSILFIIRARPKEIFFNELDLDPLSLFYANIDEFTKEYSEDFFEIKQVHVSWDKINFFLKKVFTHIFVFLYNRVLSVF